MFQATKAAQNTAPLDKLEKRNDDLQSLSDNYGIIQPSEVTPNSNSCSMSSCPCTVTFTESLKDQKTKILNVASDIEDVPQQLKRSPMKSTKYGATIVDVTATKTSDYKNDKNTKVANKNGPPPSDTVVQKYTEVMNDDKKTDKNKAGNKNTNTKENDKLNSNSNSTKTNDDKKKPPVQDKEPKTPPKTKFQVADLLKLGTLGIKKLAPMIEQMTGNLKRRQEMNKQSATVKPATVLTPYIVNKRIDSIETEPTDHKANSKFPIYIPVDELDTAESQNSYVNSTHHQNMIWASQNLKNSRNNIGFGKPVHESPLLNGGIPISPGEIITANSDVIVGKPAVGGPNIGQMGQNSNNNNKNNNNNHNGPPPQHYQDSQSQSSNFQDVRTHPPQRGQGLKHIPFIRDETYDLRPPGMPQQRPNFPTPNVMKQHQPNIPPPFKQISQNMNTQNNNNNQNFNNQNMNGENQNMNIQIGHNQNLNFQIGQNRPNLNPPHFQIEVVKSENVPYTGQNPTTTTVEDNTPHNTYIDHIGGSIHPPLQTESQSKPSFLDYIPALGSPTSYQTFIRNNLITRKNHDDVNQSNNVDDSRPTPSKEWKSEAIPVNGENQYKPIAPEPILLTDVEVNTAPKPLLVDIQPSRVANVLIPHGSTTALIFSGSSEPHKNGEYIDDPLPYPEPGYFGSFSIDAPHLTAVHVGGTVPMQQNGQTNVFHKQQHISQQHTEQRLPQNNANINFNQGPVRNNPDLQIVNHGVSGLNQDVKPPPGHRWKYEDGAHGNQPPKNFRDSVAHGNSPVGNKQETHSHFGPHQRKPEQHKVNMNFGPDVNVPPPVRNQYFNSGGNGGQNNQIKTTTAGYEGELAVPPPPPPTVQVKYESNVGVLNSDYERFKNGPSQNFGGHSQEVHVGNGQGFPIRPPNPTQSSDSNPPRITSEVYFAATASQSEDNQKLNTFNFNIPPPSNNKFNYRPQVNQHYDGSSLESVHFPSDSTKFINTFDGGLVTLNAGTKVNIPNISPTNNVNLRPQNQGDIGSIEGVGGHYTIPQAGGLITLNAGASVHGTSFPEQSIPGTSLNVPVLHQVSGQNYNYKNIKEFSAHEGESTGIPIGTNFAIKVEPQHGGHSYEPSIQIGVPGLSTADFGSKEKGPEIIVGGNSWKAGSSEDEIISYEETSSGFGKIADSVQNGNEKVHVVHASGNNVFNNTQKHESQGYGSVGGGQSHFQGSNEYQNKNQQTAQKPILNGHNNNRNVTFNQRPVIVSNNIPYSSFVSGFSNQNKKNQEPVVLSRPRVPSQNTRLDTSQNQFGVFPGNNMKTETTTRKVIPLRFDYESDVQNTENGNKVPQSLPAVNPNWQLSSRLKPTENQNNQQQRPNNEFNNKRVNDYRNQQSLTTQGHNPAYILANYNSNRQPVYDIPIREEPVYNPGKTTTHPTELQKQTTKNYAPKNQYPKESLNLNTGEYSQGSMKVPVVSSTPNILSNEVTVKYNKPFPNNSYSQDELLLSSGNDYYGLDKKNPGFNADDNIGSQTEQPFDNKKYHEVSVVTLPAVKPTNPPIYQGQYNLQPPRPFSVNEVNKGNANNVEFNKPEKPRPFQKQPQKEAGDSMILNIGEVPAKPANDAVPSRLPQAFSKNNTSYNKESNKIITSTVNASANRPLRVINITTERTPSTLSVKDIELTTKQENNTMIISNLSPPPPTMDYSFKPTNNEETIEGMGPPPKTPAPKPNKDHNKYSEVSTYRPSYNVQKNQHRRPTDYYRITSRPYTRYTTAAIIRTKPTPGTRIAFPSRSTPVGWNNPTRIETKASASKPSVQMINPSSVATASVVKIAPTTVDSIIMNPEMYPEEAVGIVVPSVIQSTAITPERVQPVIYPTMVIQPSQSMLAPTILSAPSVVYRPSVIQTSENFFNENAIKETEVIKTAPTISLDEDSRKPIKTLIHKFTVPLQTQKNTVINEHTIKPVHHAGNEIQQSDDYLEKRPEQVTAITYTTTLAEPASTIMTTRFVTLTHTLTVTQTKTSVLTPAVGSTTQTVVLTNTQTSTVVDVVTEIHTLVQPTTIVSTITKHIPITTLPDWETKYPQVPIEPTQAQEIPMKTKDINLDNVSLSSDEEDLIITPDENSYSEITMNTNDTSSQEDGNTFFVVMNKSQGGGKSPSIAPPVDNGDFIDNGVTRIEEVGTDGVSHVLLGEILLAGTPHLETSHPAKTAGKIIDLL